MVSTRSKSSGGKQRRSKKLPNDSYDIDQDPLSVKKAELNVKYAKRITKDNMVVGQSVEGTVKVMLRINGKDFPLSLSLGQLFGPKTTFKQMLIHLYSDPIFHKQLIEMNYTDENMETIGELRKIKLAIKRDGQERITSAGQVWRDTVHGLEGIRLVHADTRLTDA